VKSTPGNQSQGKPSLKEILSRMPKSRPGPPRLSRGVQRHSAKVYVETSLAIDYYLATGREWPDDHFIEHRSDYEKAEEAMWEELLKDNKRVTRATRLRKLVSWDYPEARLVVSPLVLLEMHEWIAADTIRRGLLTVTHTKAAQRFSPKEIGDLAKRLWDSGQKQPDGCRRDSAYALFHSPIGEGLVGIQVEDIPEFTLSKRAFNKVAPLAVFQIGLADILHLLVAKRLGCTHFATTDSDFQRAREIIEKELKLRLLFGDEVFSVVKPTPPPAKRSGQ
jgi:hypothetical protein